uniref:Uncharacterized protein n=1 Tax=Caenorhabditis japonica TaxID=281687 RepID=A0A8R1HTV0_CAEJA
MEKMQAKESKTEAEEVSILEEMGGNVPIVDEELLLGPDGEVVLVEDGWSGRSEKTAPSFVEVLDMIKEEEKKKSARKTRSEEDTLRGDSSWAAQMVMEVSIKDRIKLLKGWHKFIVASDKLEKEMKEKIGLFTTCSSRAKNSILAPVKKFGEELGDRCEEFGGETWIEAVMAELHKAEKRELELKVEKLEEELDRARRRLEVAEKAAKSEKKRALEMKSNLERVASERARREQKGQEGDGRGVQQMQVPVSGRVVNGVGNPWERNIPGKPDAGGEIERSDKEAL